MNDQDEIKHILLDILRAGLLRIRAFGNSGCAEACSLEADHIHNIPHLIKSLSLDELAYYYDIERTAFQSATTFDVTEFKPLWERLDKLIGVRPTNG